MHRETVDPALRVDYLVTVGSVRPSWVSPLTNGRRLDGVFPGMRYVKGKQVPGLALNPSGVFPGVSIPGAVVRDPASNFPPEGWGWVHPKIEGTLLIDTYDPQNSRSKLDDPAWQQLPYDDLGR